jgi:Cdc6-like AAA superfamily ATPase
MPKLPTLEQIENAFQPAKEIDSPARFAGRRQAISDCYSSLIAEGSSIAIIGNRGIGKSSLARQILRIAQGDKSLLGRLGITQEDRLRFDAIHYVCGKSVKTVDDLIKGLLSHEACLRDWIYFAPKSTTISRSYRPSINAGIFRLDGEKRLDEGYSPALDTHSLESVFLNVLTEFRRKNKRQRGLLIVIDEFDQISNKDGLGSLLKSVSSSLPSVKFCVVGVAQDLKDLINDHESTGRIFNGSTVCLEPMSVSELTEIVKNAESIIDCSMRFEMAATLFLAELSQGQPYMVQYVGKEALKLAFHDHRGMVTIQDVQEARKSLLKKSPEPFLEMRYQKAIGQSVNREVVLRSFAEALGLGGSVASLDAYRLAKFSNVDNPGRYSRQLLLDKYGAELAKVGTHLYKFKDPLFAAYVKIRPLHFQATSLGRYDLDDWCEK